MDDFKELIPYALQLYKLLAASGPVALLGGGLMFIVRLYRTDVVQNLLPNRVRWSSLSPMAKFLLPTGCSLLAAVVAILGGASAPLVLPMALAAAGLSMAGHHATKAMGSKLYDMSLQKDPFYEPSKARALMGLALPIPKPKLELLDKAP